MKRFLIGMVGVALWAAGASVKADSTLLLSTGNTTEDSTVAALLTSEGHNVTVGPYYQSFDGTGVTLSNYDSVILLPNDSSTGGNIPTAGQSALVNYVNAGGGLITGEWLVWGIYSDNWNQTLQSIIPVVPTGSFNSVSSITYTQATPDPGLNSGVSSSFTFDADNVGGTETYFQPRIGATVFYNSGYGDGVIGWTSGLGHVISFSTVAGTEELGNADYGRLFSNAVTWAGGGANVETLAAPEPSSIVLLAMGALGVVTYARRCRSRGGACQA